MWTTTFAKGMGNFFEGCQRHVLGMLESRNSALRRSDGEFRVTFFKPKLPESMPILRLRRSSSSSFRVGILRFAFPDVFLQVTHFSFRVK